MSPSIEIISRTSEVTGFAEETLEKVIHLLNLLIGINSHPYLKDKFILKGGTALNLFIFNLTRLSVDIDLNYVGSLDREGMLEDRPKIEQPMQAVFSREGFTVRRIPSEHAGGKWILNYQSLYRQIGVLEVDLNFMLRQPFTEVHTINSHKVGDVEARNIPVLDIHELAAGKFSALLTRTAGRDIYDAHALLNSGMLKSAVLRPIFTAYAGMSRVDFRQVKVDKIAFGAEELRNQLLPVLRSSEVDRIDDLDAWAEELCSTCRERLTLVLPFSDDEMEFLDSLNNHGVIKPELLTDDAELITRISSHPMLQWKALNVRDYRA